MRTVIRILGKRPQGYVPEWQRASDGASMGPPGPAATILAAVLAAALVRVGAG